MSRRCASVVLLVIGWLVLAACRAPVMLLPELPPDSGTLWINDRLEQVFFVQVDGIDGVQVRIRPPWEFAPGEQPSLTRGALLRLTYAPEFDQRYPDPSASANAAERWLVLTPGQQLEATFISFYPGLEGIAVWVEPGAPDQRGRSNRASPGDGEEAGELRLRLYRADDGVMLRESRIPWPGFGQAPPVTFSFDPLPDSYLVAYRVTLELVGMSDRSVLVWRDPRSEGMVFRPTFEPVVLAEVPLDRGRYSGVLGTVEVRFPEVRPTRYCVMRITLEAGEAPFLVYWSQSRPPGNVPLRSPEYPDFDGALVFNVRASQDVPVGWLASTLARGVVRRLLHDPLLLAGYGLGFGGMAVLIGLQWWRSRGRRALAP